jgi:hypothetical protein
MCVYSLRNPACKAHASYCFLWPLGLYYILQHYLIIGTIFEIRLLNIKRMFLCYLQLLSATFLIVRRNERDMIKNVGRFSCKVLVILVRFEWTWNFWTDFRKIMKYNTSWKCLQREPIYSMRTDRQTDRQTDRRTDMTKLVVAFRNFCELAYRLLLNEQLCKRNMQELMYKTVRINCRIVHLLLPCELFSSS